MSANPIIAILALAICMPAMATERSSAVRSQFQRHTICPSTGKYGRCRDHVIDHVMPLCAGGADNLANLQYQTIEDAKIKDRWERKLCRDMRREHG
jgi:5-methylcytosine-specific restriction endonuclease McrA